MKKEAIGTGKTIEDAINRALAKLGVPREDVSIEVLETSSKGFLGIGGTEAKVKLTYETLKKDKAKAFLGEVLPKLGVRDAIIEADEEDGVVRVNLMGDDVRIAIGRRGETLDALQYLTSLVVNKGEEGYTRVSIDAENYREKREETLVRLAKKVAARAVKYRSSVTLEPMNPYERRIIHEALHGYPGVSTHSIGSEPMRKVVVSYVGAGSKSGASNGANGGAAGRGRSSGQ